MYNYLFQVISDSDIEDIRDELHKMGLKDIYLIEEDATGKILIGGHSRKKIRTKHANLLKENLSVNWEDQWSMFAQDFKDGKAHINLESFGSNKSLILMPGAGFGDLSHPTTYLMLEMMKGRVRGESIFDIGTGCGILSLSAILLGAKSSFGIDIDQEAILHARKNARLNQLRAKFGRALPKKIDPSIFLMNMILPEQKEFDPSRLNKYAKSWIISGILKEQKNEYLKLTTLWGWHLITEYSKDDWMGWIFYV